MRRSKKYFARPQNWMAFILIGVFVFMALFAPWLTSVQDSEEFSPFRVVEDLKSRTPVPPNKQALLGTIPANILGQQWDIFYTLVWGSRSALRFGLFVALFSAFIGVLVGAISAYLGGSLNSLSMRVTDAFLAIPMIVGVVFIQQIAGTTRVFQGSFLGEPTLAQRFLANIDPLMLALIFLFWMPYARITNSLVLRVKQLDFVIASKSLGAGHLRIVFRHLIPNTISPAIVLTARDIGGIVILQATLTFIGVAGGSAWGELLAEGRRWIIGPGGNPLTYWWVFIPLTLAIVLFGVGWNLLGDGLNDWLSPRRT